jgi:putative hydrolase of the HAD superfamily
MARPGWAAHAALDRVTHVFFDFSGTLVEGVPNWEHPQIVACRECGLDATPDEVKAAIWKVWGPIEGCAHVADSVDEAAYARWIGEIERQILRGLRVPEPQLGLASRRVMELQVAPECYRVFPDVVPALQSLHNRGLKLGLVSNHAWRLPELVNALGLGEYFDPVVTSARAGYRKPRPEIFRLALDAASADPRSTLYVGDDPVCDVRGAAEAGLRSLWLDRKQAGSSRDGRIGSLVELVGDQWQKTKNEERKGVTR